VGEVVFLLGAGASRDAGLPLMDELSKGFTEWQEHGPAPLMKPAEKTRLGNLFDATIKLVSAGDAAPNIELVLSFLTATLSFKRDPHDKALKAWNPPFDGDAEDFVELIRQIRLYIRDSLQATDPASADYLSGLLDFKTDQSPVDVFTLNYDRLVQAMGARFAVRYTTGFGDTWDAGLFAVPGWDMRIFKLHGSVDWNRLPSRGVIYQGGQEHHAFPGEKPTDLLLYPAEGKVTMAEPFATLMGWFTEGLRQAKTCVAIGYSFVTRMFAV